MRSIWGITAGCLLLSPPSVHGENLPLTWAECVRYATQHNPDLSSAALAMESSRANYRGSFNGVFPHLALTHSYSTDSSDDHLWQADGVASLDLINVNQWASIQTASAVLRQNEARRQQTSAAVLLSLSRAFAGLLYGQEQVSVASNIRDLWRRSAQLVDLRYQSGRESKGNAMRTRAETLQADLALQQAFRDLRLAQQQLSQAMGLDEFSALAVTGTWTTTQAMPALDDIARRIETLPSIREQQAFTEQAKASIRAAQSALWPTLSLRYSRSLTGQTEFPKDPSWGFTGQVSLPFFAGGPTEVYFASVAAARAYEKSKEDLVSLRHQARTDLESAWSAWAKSLDQVAIQTAFLEAAAQRKGESDIRYQSGLMSFQDWQVIMNDYVNAQRGVLSAKQNVKLAEAQWGFASGLPLGEPR